MATKIGNAVYFCFSLIAIFMLVMNVISEDAKQSFGGQGGDWLHFATAITFYLIGRDVRRAIVEKK